MHSDGNIIKYIYSSNVPRYNFEVFDYMLYQSQSGTALAKLILLAKYQNEIV